MTTVLKGVRVPTWALNYLVNGDSGLSPEDKKLVDDWVEKTRDGGRIDVCCHRAWYEIYFSWAPAFGLASNVVDCDVVITKGD